MNLGLKKVLGLASGFCLMIGSLALGQEKRALRPEDLADIRSLSNIQISADGRRVAFVVTEPADPAKPQKPRDTNIWVVPADGSESARLFAASPKSDTHPRWSPDGRYLALLSDRGEPAGDEKETKNQVYLMRTDGGEAEQLTNLKGSVEDLRWSRDGKMIAFTARDPETDAEQKKHKEGYDENFVDHLYKFARLWVLTLAERKAEQVIKQDLHVSGFDWFPDGAELAVRVSSTPRNDDVYWHARVVVVRRLTGEIVRTLSENVAGDARWSPDGQTIAFEEYSPNRIASWLVVAPAAGGPARPLLKDYAGTVRDFEWEADSKHLVAEVNERTRDKFLRVDSGDGSATEIPAETALAGADFAISQDGRVLAYARGNEDHPPDVFSWFRQESPQSTPTGEPMGPRLPRRLTDLNPQSKTWRLGAVKEISWKSKRDGTALYGVLVTPPDFKPAQTYPTIVEVHGGPEWAWWSGWLGSWHEWAQLLASNGYVVFLPNPRGSTGQGWKFAEANRDDWGGGDFRDIMDGVDDLIGQKIADPNRLGIGGWSYGGFMTSWAVTQTNRFQAAVVGAAVTNLFSFDGTTDITPTFLRNYFLDLPFARRADYDNHSAMTFLKNCKTPSLILHGESDERVPTSQGWEFYNGLRMLGVPAEMVTYPREHHGFRERAHQVELLTRLLAWYDKYLKQ
ncbi:MAG: S9 family peptidase [Acidobacteriia bacterium]|nr:S9 family peptidase [Terriglobia bacterium]